MRGLLAAGGIGRHPAIAAGAVEHGEVELGVAGVEIGEQVEDLVEHVEVALVGPVDLVDGDDRPQAALSAFDTTNLVCGSGPSEASTSSDDAVDHVEDALDLAAEVGVAWRVDDVDARALPHERGVLGENRDAALAFQIVGIHGALDDALVLAKRARLFQKLVDERRLAMVDVRDDRDVAELHGCSGLGRREARGAMIARA